MHCLRGRRLNRGQTHSPLVAINRHVFILHMYTPPIHDRYAPDVIVSTTSVYFSSYYYCLFYRAVGTGYRLLPTTEKNQIKEDYMHRYVSSYIACPPVVSGTGYAVLLMIAHRQVFMYVYALINSKDGGRDLLPRAATPNLSTTADSRCLDMGIPRLSGKNVSFEGRNR